MYSLVDKVLSVMGDQFPELEKALDYTHRVVKAEEESFLETLGTGLSFLTRFYRMQSVCDQGKLPRRMNCDLTDRLETFWVKRSCRFLIWTDK